MTMPLVSTEAGEGGSMFNANARDAQRAQASTQSSGEPAIPNGQPSSQAMAALGVAAPQQTSSQQPQAPLAPWQQVTPQPSGGDPLKWFAPNQAKEQVQQSAAPVLQQQLTPEQQKANSHGQNIVDNYSKYIQDAAEIAYSAAQFNALNTPGYLDSMIDSGDKLQVELAKKVLERNADQFDGVKTIEEYQAIRELAKAGDDPAKREIAELKMNQTKMQRENADRDWQRFKEKRHIAEGSEFDKLCDSVRKEYPNMAQSDIIHTARGRSGIDPTKFGSPEATVQNGIVAGGRGPKEPEGGHQPSGEHLQIFGVKPGVAESSERYFSGLGKPGIH